MLVFDERGVTIKMRNVAVAFRAADRAIEDEHEGKGAGPATQRRCHETIRAGMSDRRGQLLARSLLLVIVRHHVSTETRWRARMTFQRKIANWRKISHFCAGRLVDYGELSHRTR